MRAHPFLLLCRGAQESLGTVVGAMPELLHTDFVRLIDHGSCRGGLLRVCLISSRSDMRSWNFPIMSVEIANVRFRLCVCQVKPCRVPTAQLHR